MAVDTPASLKNLILYEVYVRNHTQEGTFRAIEPDLDRIRDLGVDVVWFMPIHPIGKLNKKGGLGCPYSIADYRQVNPEYGTMQDFKHLVDQIHARGMKLMIDVVYNHTAHDSVLVKEHPEFFHQDKHGKPITTVPEWSDVIDLKHPNPQLSEYLIESLLLWSDQGVDGFRCDVASLVPLEFWRAARKRLAAKNPNTFWLAESVHAGFLEHRHAMGLSGFSDSQIYEAFDMTYDYDIWPILMAAITRQVPLGRAMEMIRFQQAIYPANYNKMHCVENHDQRRIQLLANDPESAMAWTAFQVFNRGAFLIYGGQESAATHTPTLFDRDPVEWKDYPLQGFYRRMFAIKKDPLLLDGVFTITRAEPFIQAVYTGTKASLVGIFNPNGVRGEMEVQIPNGKYTDLISGSDVVVRGNQIDLPASAVIFEVPAHLDVHPFHSPLLDFHLRPI
jgi:glycosidase